MVWKFFCVCVCVCVCVLEEREISRKSVGKKKGNSRKDEREF